MNEIRLHESPSLLGRMYVEITPGTFAGRSSCRRSIYFDDEVFGLLEIVLSRHVEDYDRCGVNVASREKWCAIIADLERLRRLVTSASGVGELYGEVAFLFAGTREYFRLNFDSCCQQLARMIDQFVSWLRRELELHSHIAIVGV